MEIKEKNSLESMLATLITLNIKVKSLSFLCTTTCFKKNHFMSVEDSTAFDCVSCVTRARLWPFAWHRFFFTIFFLLLSHILLFILNSNSCMSNSDCKNSQSHNAWCKVFWSCFIKVTSIRANVSCHPLLRSRLCVDVPGSVRHWYCFVTVFSPRRICHCCHS